MSKYIVQLYVGNQYEVVDPWNGEVVYTGTIEEVNAWLSLREMGYKL